MNSFIHAPSFGAKPAVFEAVHDGQGETKAALLDDLKEAT
jgi:hypothetical protein